MSEEWVGGKGSRQRNADRQKFDDNYDKIFGRKKVKEKKKPKSKK